MTIEKIDDKQLMTLQGQVPTTGEAATAFVIVSEQHLEIANENTKGVKLLIKQIEEFFKPHKQRATAVHKGLCEDEKKLIDPLKQAEEIYKQKMFAFHQAENKRLEDEARLRALDIQKEKERAIAKINNQIEKIKGQTQDIVAQRTALEAMLEDPNVSDEEAGIIRSQIETLTAAIANKQETVELKELTVNDIATTPEPAAIPEKSAKPKGTSFSTEKVPESVFNPEALCKWVLSTNTFGIIDWNMGQIKKLLNAGMTLPGIKIIEKPAIKTRV